MPGLEIKVQGDDAPVSRGVRTGDDQRGAYRSYEPRSGDTVLKTLRLPSANPRPVMAGRSGADHSTVKNDIYAHIDKDGATDQHDFDRDT